MLFSFYDVWESDVCETMKSLSSRFIKYASQIARLMGPTWGQPGSCRSQMGPMLAPWTLLSRSLRQCKVDIAGNSRPPTGCHHCGQTLTIDHMLLKCALLQECRDEYYTVDSLNALFDTIPETCIVEFLREAGFFYLIWCNSLTSTSPQTRTIWSDFSNCLENESNSETLLLV